jgi:hypothetical protein
MAVGFALDAGGNHTFTYGVSQGGLRYGYHDGSNWTSSTIATGSFTGEASSLIYVDGTPHVVYGQDIGTTIGFYHAWLDGDTWLNQSISDSSTWPRHSALAADADGNLAAAWLDEHEHGTDDDTLDFAFFDGSSWTTQSVSTSLLIRGNLDLIVAGAASEASLAYIDMQPGIFMPSEPTWAERSGGTWNSDVGLGGVATDIFAEYISATLTPEGNPAVAYIDTWNGGLHYAVRTESGWTVETVDPMMPAMAYSDRRYTAMATDDWGYIHLLYFDPDANELKYRYRDSEGWSSARTIANAAAHWLSLEIDGTQTPHFAYYDNDSGSIYSGLGQAVPEPGTLGLIFAGLAALAARRRRAGTREHEQQ